MIGQKELQEQLEQLQASKQQTQTQLNSAQSAVQQLSGNLIATDGAIQATQMLIDKLEAMSKEKEKESVE